MLKRLCLLVIFHYLILESPEAQETNSRASGRVFLENLGTADGVYVMLIHGPTQNKYVSLTNHDGQFHFFNVKPGGPYRLVFTNSGYDTLKIDNLSVHLTGDHFLQGTRELTDFMLKEKIIELTEVVINAKNDQVNKNGIETNINSGLLKSMPAINRSFQDFIRMVPQAKVNGDGAISLGGQNNRFNAFFIDGANNNDLQGLAVNGNNGGQTGSSPISIEAIEAIQVSLAPYDVQYSNFTGATINAITRSGSNENKSSFWYFFRNENLAGRSPRNLEKPGSPGEFYRPKLSPFFNQTFGAWNSGPLVSDKLFYFLLLERQSELRPQPFNVNEYRGSSNQQQLQALSDFLKQNYDYDPGSFLETTDELKATRINLKLDWNASIKNKFMLSYRFNQAERTTPRLPSSANAILFKNNGIVLPAATHSTSFEWKSFIQPKLNNRLLLTLTNQESDRNRIGQPFPGITIADGSGSLFLGSDLNSAVADFKASDFTLFNVFKYVEQSNIISAGMDINYTSLRNRTLPGFFGLYNFRNLNDFMNGSAPIRLQRSFPLPDKSNTSTRFHTLKTSFFINDEINPVSYLKVNFGIRLDINSIISKPAEDLFYNDTAIPIISKYYNLDGSVSGKTMKPNWFLSPRASVDYKLTKHGLHLKAGAGVFLGRIINFWSSEVFNSVLGSIDIIPQQFIPDPYGQPSTQSLNLNPEDYKGTLNLVSKNFKYPSVFKSSLVAEKLIKKNWILSVEALFTKNINEVAFRNVNILPPVRTSSLPGSRNVYSTNTIPSKIDLKEGLIRNPYAGVFLLTNNPDKKGHSYSISFIIQKHTDKFSFNGSYTYGRSDLLFEISGPQTPIASQWRNVETVNGRNYTMLSTSDNELRHRITTWLSYKINYLKNKTATTVSLFYNGQSGSPYSYVYRRSMINDNGSGNDEIFDLIYIPTNNELASMSFIPVSDNAGRTYSAREQKDLLNAFINSDDYLNNHRGAFADRNGARLPFTHVVDLRVQQDISIRISGKSIGITITYDVFNFTNMLNKNWGRSYFLTNDSYPLIRFAGFADTSTLTPQFQFTPFNGPPYSLQTSTLPINSARWISQLGMKINLN